MSLSCCAVKRRDPPVFPDMVISPARSFMQEPAILRCSCPNQDRQAVNEGNLWGSYHLLRGHVGSDGPTHDKCRRALCRFLSWFLHGSFEEPPKHTMGVAVRFRFTTVIVFGVVRSGAPTTPVPTHSRRHHPTLASQ